MALTDILQRRVRARKDGIEDRNMEDDFFSGEEIIHGGGSDGEDNSSDTSDNVESDLEGGSSGNGTQEEEKESLSTHSSPQPDSLTNISFGTLAAAQDSLSLAPLKRKYPQSHTPPDLTNEPFPEALERRAGKKDHRTHSRPSKHAPTVLSSKKAVSRKRSVIPTPTPAPRDPRFMPLSGPLSSEQVAKNYAFLDAYRASEIASLKTAIRNTRNDDAAREALQKTLRSMESRQQTQAAKEAQQEVIREHRRKEKEAVEKGKRPYYLKRGEQKKLALVKRFEGLGEKKVKRVIERRRKKKAGKEKKGMPFKRRSVDGGGGGGEGD